MLLTQVVRVKSSCVVQSDLRCLVGSALSGEGGIIEPQSSYFLRGECTPMRVQFFLI